MGSKVIIYDKVRIGKDSIIEDFVVLGKTPINSECCKLKELVIGDYPIIRSGTIIYAGTKIGDCFQTGDGARIRENNIIGDYVSIGSYTVIERDCVIGDKVRIHSNCFIPEYTTIEEGVWIGPGVVMTNVLHPPCPMFKKYAPEPNCCRGPTIKKYAVIGAGAVILPGIVVGENALVGAGAVVTKDVLDCHVVAGIPASTLKEIQELRCKSGFFTRGKVYSWRKKNEQRSDC
jgi:acetyltransferase-like isoleucine patch superfamily enzyme